MTVLPIHLLLQMQWFFLILISVLALELAQCTWMKLSALAEKLTLLTAPEALLSVVLLSTHIQEYDVKVCENINIILQWNDNVCRFTSTKYRIFMNSQCVIIAYSKCKWKLYLRRCSSGGRLQSV